jgi:hypothetical protein
MKASMLKLLVLAASLGAALVSGCAELTAAPAAAGASAADAAQSAIDTPGNAQSPYPAATDAGIF